VASSARSIEATHQRDWPFGHTTLDVERILQFGTGRFLRGFVGAFVQDANETTAHGGPGPARIIDVVESTGSGRAALLAAQSGRYRLLVRGLAEGEAVDTVRVVDCIGGTFDIRADPAAVWQASMDPDLRIIVSNTTEAGYRSGPDAFPAHLLEVLARRAEADLPGVTILPCELLERNGERLRGLVHDEAVARGSAPAFIRHVLDGNHWAVTLVDRIVTSPPADLPQSAGDPLAVAVEPYASWIVELPDASGPAATVPAHPAVHLVNDVTPYALRKIRILNGAHTALVARSRGLPHWFVREALADRAIAGWLEELLREEVVPALGERIDDGQSFVTEVLERFRNPFVDHRLADIAVDHAVKVSTRLIPTYQEYLERFGREPDRLGRLLASEGFI
jgi:tagaturonate reductase